MKMKEVIQSSFSFPISGCVLDKLKGSKESGEQGTDTQLPNLSIRNYYIEMRDQYISVQPILDSREHHGQTERKCS